MEIKGTLIKVLPTEKGSGRNGEWRKTPFVIETEGQYPKTVCFEAWSELSDTVRGLVEGNMLKVQFDPESREYNGRWYTQLRAWKVQQEGGAAEGKQYQQAINETQVTDDLPF